MAVLPEALPGGGVLIYIEVIEERRIYSRNSQCVYKW
jgi:hypothetical protein